MLELRVVFRRVTMKAMAGSTGRVWQLCSKNYRRACGLSSSADSRGGGAT